jgi:hypothetical protein
MAPARARLGPAEPLADSAEMLDLTPRVRNCCDLLRRSSMKKMQSDSARFASYVETAFA